MASLINKSTDNTPFGLYAMMCIFHFERIYIVNVQNPIWLPLRGGQSNGSNCHIALRKKYFLHILRILSQFMMCISHFEVTLGYKMQTYIASCAIHNFMYILFLFLNVPQRSKCTNSRLPGICLQDLVNQRVNFLLTAMKETQ